MISESDQSMALSNVCMNECENTPHNFGRWTPYSSLFQCEPHNTSPCVRCVLDVHLVAYGKWITSEREQKCLYLESSCYSLWFSCHLTCLMLSVISVKKKNERHVVYVCGCYSAIHCAIVTRHSAKTDINFRIFKANTHKTVTWRPNSRISVSALDEQTNRHAATQVTLSKVVKLNSC